MENAALNGVIRQSKTALSFRPPGEIFVDSKDSPPVFGMTHPAKLSYRRRPVSMGFKQPIGIVDSGFRRNDDEQRALHNVMSDGKTRQNLTKKRMPIWMSVIG